MDATQLPPPVIFEFPPHVLGSILLIGLAALIALVLAVASLPDHE